MEYYLAQKRKNPPQIGFSEKFPYKCFIDEGIILHDDDTYTMQQSFWVNGMDFESAERYEQEAVTRYLNMIFAGIATGWVMNVDNFRIRKHDYLDTSKNEYTSKLLRKMDAEREFFFRKQAIIFENKCIVTFTYRPLDRQFRKLGNFFVKNTYKSSPKTNLEIELDNFKKTLAGYTRLIDRALNLKPLTDEETISYLNYSITGKWHNIKLPKNTYIDLKYLLGEEYRSGLEPMVGNKHLRIIAIDNHFPDGDDASKPLLLERLFNLGFEFRWNTRFFFVTKIEAQKYIDRLSDFYEQDIDGFAGGAMKNTAFKGRVNKGAERLYYQLQQLKSDIVTGEINEGFYNCEIILYHEDNEKEDSRGAIIAKMNQVMQLLEELGFKTREERIGSEQAFLGSIAGDIYSNKRRCLISTENLAHLMPLSGFYSGKKYHPSQLMPEKSNALFMVDCNRYQSFYGNAYVHDNGHSLVIGKTGSGKSTLVNFLIASHMRYPRAQFFGFDNKHSMMPLTYGVEGNHFDIGVDNVCFQPLANVDKIDGFDFAVDWLESLCQVNNVMVDIDITNAIRESLEHLTVDESQYRTMQRLLMYARTKNENLAKVISAYVGEETIQSLVFSANKDNISLSNFNVFELSQIIPKGDKALIPVLKYLFYKIMSRLDGSPTLIVIEEAWMAFKSPVFADKLAEWLKTLRKLNVYIIMVTLQVKEIMNAAIYDTLITQCSTVFYVANPELEKADVREDYKRFGLKDRQIYIIQNATMKKEYYVSNGDGDRLFNLDMSYFKVGSAFLCRTSVDDAREAKRLKKESNNYIADWMKYCGIKEKIIESVIA